MGTELQTGKANFGTAPVFLTAISTILGAVMFLRFGYAVGNVGFIGLLFIIFVGHLVTIPTAMAIAEIATNQKVEGGGEYYIISRSFGIIIGAAIGIALFFSQAISVAFYVIAFAEAFDPLLRFFNEYFDLMLTDKRIISLPACLILTTLILTKGANLGIKLLYFVVGVLFVSLALFFMGETGLPLEAGYHPLVETIDSPAPWFFVFAICFPAFTGMTAGVGLSGDLREPKRSIPLGTLGATLAGMVIYIFVAYKLALSASPQDLAADQLIMSRIALWGPIIPIGLACATVSSALGSFLVAPRTLQAIAGDRVFPWPRLNTWLAQGKEGSNEPINASLITALIALTFVAMGSVNFVARIISMFFMVTYGSLCLISFLEHFAADPSYRPQFRSRWYLSLFGAVMCFWLMFRMSAFFAMLAIVAMFILYSLISYYNAERGGLSNIIQGAIFQLSRQLKVFLQKSQKQEEDSWRPSVVCISSATFQRLAAFDVLRWISHRYGFGAYVHYIKGYLSRATQEDSQLCLQRLVKMAGVSESNVYVDTMVSPSYTSAISQVVQLPGISGKENNMVLFEFSRSDPQELADIVDNYRLVAATGFDVCILASSERGFGYRREIHVWFSSRDHENASLMILLAYILLGHPDWKGAVIKIFSLLPEAMLPEERDLLSHLIRAGRLPISGKNIELIVAGEGMDRQAIVRERSLDADLIIIGVREGTLKRWKQQKTDIFAGYDELGNILYVNTKKEVDLFGESEQQDSPGGTSSGNESDATETS